MLRSTPGPSRRPGCRDDPFTCLTVTITVLAGLVVLASLVVTVAVDPEAWPLVVTSAAVLLLWLLAAPRSEPPRPG